MNSVSLPVRSQCSAHAAAALMTGSGASAAGGKSLRSFCQRSKARPFPVRRRALYARQNRSKSSG